MNTEILKIYYLNRIRFNPVYFLRFRNLAPLRLFFYVLCFISPICGQTISGNVTDTQNAPVVNADVSVSVQNKIIAQTQTDAAGKFSITANGENPKLIIEASNFADYEKSIKEIDFSSPLIIVLQPHNLSEEVTVSITRTESRLSETPASVVVLDRETLETTAAQTVDDRLRQIAGFTLFRRSSSRTSNPTTQGANLRGLSGSGASRAGVLFDGLSLNDAFGGWTYWSRVPNIAVEQAEVLRGGASAFYGNAALSGAVNLISSKAKANEPIFRFQTSAGTQNTFDASVFTAYNAKDWSFDLAAETFQTAGYIPTAEDQRGAVDTQANSRRNNAILTIGRNYNENARIFLRGNLFAERRDNGTSLTNNRTYFRQIAGGADFANEKTGAFQLRAFFEKQVYDQTFSAISNNRSAETLSRIQRVPSQAFGANLFWSKVFGVHVVSGSFEFREVRGFSDETIFANNRSSSLVGSGGRDRTFSVFAQDVWRVTKKLNVSIGGRFDVWKNFAALSANRNLSTNLSTVTNFSDRNENSFSPRFAALYQINRNFSAVAAYSKSFRAPTLNELYRAFRVGNVLTLANENLKSERADTFETGVNFTGFSRKLNLRGNFFVAEISRPIVSITFTNAPNLITRQRQNVGETRSRGFEFDAEYAPIRNLRFSTSYLLVDSRVTGFPNNPDLIGKFLPQIPGQQLTFQTVYRPQEKLLFSLQGRISSSQYEDDLNSLRLHPFFTLDAFASYKFNKFEIFAAVENIFNNRFDVGLTPNRTVAAPRFGRIGLRFDFREK
ncbi:MAG TPA: TonB-dependent receptor [Pyrinomonadaceae bacterium]